MGATTDQIPLDEVASRAGVSVQAVIRRFGGKEGLLASVRDREASRVSGRRDEARREMSPVLSKCWWLTTKNSATVSSGFWEKRTAFREKLREIARSEGRINYHTSSGATRVLAWEGPVLAFKSSLGLG